MRTQRRVVGLVGLLGSAVPPAKSARPSLSNAQVRRPRKKSRGADEPGRVQPLFCVGTKK